MRIDILTLFPAMFDSVLGSSILKRAADPTLHETSDADAADNEQATASDDVAPPRDAAAAGDAAAPVSYHVHDIRAYTTNKHQKVDKAPFGGGPGMVMQCQPVWDAVQAVEAMDPAPATRILLTPQGEAFRQTKAASLARLPRLLLIAGHYEGIDERVIDALQPMMELSIGDYVLSGGELPAMVVIDAVVRLIPGVLGHEQSAHFDSFSPGAHGLLDYPHYTRPRVWQGQAAPDVLLSGDHAKIEAWRREQALKRTLERRPDLLRDENTGDEPQA